MTRKNEPGTPRAKGMTSGSGTTTRYRNRDNGAPARWSEVGGDGLIACLDAIQSAGDALLLGTSRDGNVLIATVCSGDERTKFYAKSASEMNQHLFDITASALGLSHG